MDSGIFAELGFQIDNVEMEANSPIDTDNTYRIIFLRSFDRCFRTVKTDIAFVNGFCLRLKARDSGIREILNRLPVMKQTQKLRCALYTLANVIREVNEDDVLLLALATYCHRAMGVTSAMIDVWLECLIETVSEYDEQFDEIVATAWRTALSPAIETLKSGLGGEN
ncbi:globin [Hahella aquimaris]|uniref:globin n=1 Tax=Hahella sp. HNIBRBA332 TaxID=3015983 RepID=UPI00273B5743|nr:globin [Hahella sp. HNIBRBA332]WLQ13290.1 globin [Hahella sp. HNIBRBA332]